jgi:plastocyanin
MESRRLTVFATAIALVLAGCSGSGTEGSTTTEAGVDTTSAAVDTTAGDQGTASITIADFAFTAPDSVSVGTTVEVTNEDSVSHTWTSENDVFDSGSLGQSDTFEFTFDEPGEYPFFCKFHPGQMVGSITVEG